MLSNLLAIVAIGIWIYFGFSFVSLFLYKFLNRETRVAIGIPVGIIVFTWCVFILNLKFCFSPLLGWGVTSFLLGVSYILNYFTPKGKTPSSLSRKLFFLFIGIPTLFLCFVMKISFLYKGNITRGAVYGDFPFHMNIISSFVHGCNSQRESIFDIVSPFFANVHLAYPVLVNFLSATLIGCFNINLPSALLYPSMPMALSIFILLNQIVVSFSGKKSAALLAPWLFIFLGGRGFLNYFNKVAREDTNADFVHIWGNNMYRYWLQTIMHVLLPQRLSLFGLPFSFSFLVIMEAIKFKSIMPYILCGLIVALMPQVQAHACIAAFEWTLAYAIINFPWRKPSLWWSQLRCYFALSIPALVLAVPQLIPFLPRAGGKGFSSFKPIWTDDQTSFIKLWWDGLFVFWAISIFFGLLVLTKKQIISYMPSLFVFVMSNLIHYQPWNMDNSKVFYAGWIPFAVAVVANYLSLLTSKRNKAMKLFAGILFLCCTMSGFLCCWRGLGHGAPQWNPYENISGFVSEIVRKTEPKSVWATDSFHDHPVATLAGRQILVGYRGWMPSHNLNDADRIKAMKNICSNPNDTKWMDQNNVTYICYHKTSHAEIYKDINASTKWDLFMDFDTWKVYKRNKVL